MQMSSCVNEDSVNNLELTKSQYLKILAPPLKEEQYSKANIPTYTTSLSYIRTLPLLDQIRTLMKDGTIEKFLFHCVLCNFFLIQKFMDKSVKNL